MALLPLLLKQGPSDFGAGVVPRDVLTFNSSSRVCSCIRRLVLLWTFLLGRLLISVEPWKTNTSSVVGRGFRPRVPRWFPGSIAFRVRCKPKCDSVMVLGSTADIKLGKTIQETTCERRSCKNHHRRKLTAFLSVGRISNVPYECFLCCFFTDDIRLFGICSGLRRVRATCTRVFCVTKWMPITAPRETYLLAERCKMLHVPSDVR
jgi:hypothetical protein